MKGSVMAKTQAEQLAMEDDRIKEIRREIAAVKDILDPQRKRARANPGLVEAGKKYRWKPGQSGNPGGRTSEKLRYWAYVVDFLKMTRSLVEAYDETYMTCAQLGAKKFALAVADGRWIYTKEVIERELGRAKDVVDNSDEYGPKLIQLPFGILKNEEQGSN